MIPRTRDETLFSFAPAAHATVEVIKEEEMQRLREGEDVLVKDKSYVKFERLLEKAEAEGRLDGNYKCLTCGMRYMSKDEAEGCCKILP